MEACFKEEDMKIYTKNGDKGYTSNFKGEKLWKGSLWIELQGNIDEINANVGHLRSLNQRITQQEDIDQMLEWIQYCLFRIGSDISLQFQVTYITDEMIEKLEKAIDTYTEKTGELHSFIHFNGNEAATYAHVIRSVTRRCERVFSKVLQEIDFTLDYQYVNRLSDYFFQLARYLNHVNGNAEEVMVVRD
jgi:cob(I)alamin adenosyltransferase